jgi:hypothetical protein
MKKAIFLFSIVFISYSSDGIETDSVCSCEEINFRYVINRSQNQFGEFSGEHCLSYWENPDFFNLEIDNSSNPPTVTGVTEATFDAAKQRFPCD